MEPAAVAGAAGPGPPGPGRAQLAAANIAREYQKRKQLEEDALKMRNRLLQLERHAHKVAQRVARTRERTQAIESQRERNAALAAEKRRRCEERARVAQKQRQQIARCGRDGRLISSILAVSLPSDHRCRGAENAVPVGAIATS